MRSYSLTLVRVESSRRIRGYRYVHRTVRPLLCLSRIFLFHKNWHPHAQTPSEGVREKQSNIPDPPGPWLLHDGAGRRVGSSDVKTWASPTARAGEHSVDGSHRPIKTLACGANAPLGHLTWYAAQGALRRRQVITGSHCREFEGCDLHRSIKLVEVLRAVAVAC